MRVRRRSLRFRAPSDKLQSRELRRLVEIVVARVPIRERVLDGLVGVLERPTREQDLARHLLDIRREREQARSAEAPRYVVAIARPLAEVRGRGRETHGSSAIGGDGGAAERGERRGYGASPRGAIGKPMAEKGSLRLEPT